MGYAISQLTALPFGNIIGGPMKAAIEAQSLAAKATVDFIKTVGFKPKDQEADPFFPDDGGDADIGDVRYVTFKYTIKDAEQNQSEASLEVPILTIVPIPFLRIDEMNIDFMAKIMEQQTFKLKKDTTTNFGTSTHIKAGARWWWANVSTDFKASFSVRHSSSTEANSRYQTETTMNVNVRAVQDELPAGMSRMLNLLESMIKEDRKQLQASSSGTSTSGSTTSTSGGGAA